MTYPVDAEQLPLLTVAQLIKDLASFPQDAEVVSALVGGGMTIPIVQAVVINTEEGKELTVFMISPAAAKRAILHAEEAINALN